MKVGKVARNIGHGHLQGSFLHCLLLARAFHYDFHRKLKEIHQKAIGIRPSCSERRLPEAFHAAQGYIDVKTTMAIPPEDPAAVLEQFIHDGKKNRVRYFTKR